MEARLKVTDHEKSGGLKLNGYKVPIVINLSFFIPVFALLITMWADVRELKRDAATAVTADRVTRIEERMDRREELRSEQIKNIGERLTSIERILDRQARRDTWLRNGEGGSP